MNKNGKKKRNDDKMYGWVGVICAVGFTIIDIIYCCKPAQYTNIVVHLFWIFWIMWSIIAAVMCFKYL